MEPSNEENVKGCCLCYKCYYYLAVLIILITLFKYKNPLQFYVKYFVYVMLAALNCTIFIPYLALRPRWTGNLE
jgi:hypothetical protein